jgi:hypothetical protein
MKQILVFLTSCLLSPAFEYQLYGKGMVYVYDIPADKSVAAKDINPAIVPNYRTDSPKEAGITADTIAEAVIREASENEVARTIKHTAETRENYKIDVDSNPLFTTANEVLEDPEAAIKSGVVDEEEDRQPEPEELHTCYVGGEDYQRSCQRRLEITLEIIPSVAIRERYCNGHWKNKATGKKKYCNPGCKERTIGYKPKQVRVAREVWVDDCKVLEDLVDKGVCRYQEKTESQKNETRTIQGEPITRDHFEERLVYSCSHPVQDTCTSLKAMGCHQVNSECDEKIEGRCVAWKQTYRCQSKIRKQPRYQASKDSPFCLTGNCADSSYKANGEMLDALSQLSVLKTVQDDLRANTVSVFRGEARKCSRHCVNFKDCCGTERGWGTDLHLASCKPAEKELVKLRKDKKCVQVGTYCAEKKAGICIRKKTGFCCFGSKLSRLIQEQGRRQIGLTWGTPEEPDCRGLKTEELAKLDFSRMNLSELYEDVRKNFTTRTADTMPEAMTIERVQENMKRKVQG